MYYFGDRISSYKLHHAGEPTCEVGYAWEKWVFGWGQFRGDDGEVMLRNWPNRDLVDIDLVQKACIGVRDVEALPAQIKLRADPAQIAACFGKTLWEAPVKSDNGRSLKPLRLSRLVVEEEPVR